MWAFWLPFKRISELANLQSPQTTVPALVHSPKIPESSQFPNFPTQIWSIFAHPPSTLHHTPLATTTKSHYQSFFLLPSSSSSPAVFVCAQKSEKNVFSFKLTGLPGTLLFHCYCSAHFFLWGDDVMCEQGAQRTIWGGFRAKIGGKSIGELWGNEKWLWDRRALKNVKFQWKMNWNQLEAVQ